MQLMDFVFLRERLPPGTHDLLECIYVLSLPRSEAVGFSDRYDGKSKAVCRGKRQLCTYIRHHGARREEFVSGTMVMLTL